MVLGVIQDVGVNVTVGATAEDDIGDSTQAITFWSIRMATDEHK